MQVLLLGAGKIGSGIAEFLATTGDYEVTVADREPANLERLPPVPGIRTLQLDAGDAHALDAAVAGKFAVVNAGPFNVNAVVAGAAAAKDAHYLDLSEDLAGTHVVRELAAQSNSAMIPQCGLAPGFVSVAACELARKFDKLERIHLRVGALPRYPAGALKYNLTWSTDGLINEYCNPCEAIASGEPVELQPLEGLETFSLDGIDYEAFNTSGGLGSLRETFAGKVDELNYRTIRYPGHRDIMKALLEDLKLRDRRELLKDILESALPHTGQDVVVIRVSVSGLRNGCLEQETWANRIYHRNINGRPWSAIRLTTAAGACAALDLLAQGKLPGKGLVRQEDIPFGDFIHNRFGRYFASGPEIIEPAPLATARTSSAA
ncbi:MAG: NAD(P)H-binding protein [Acidimicrobiia bacterium]|nr:NAD(P)H-binding protein [Acidimicrobiia bacterium]